MTKGRASGPYRVYLAGRFERRDELRQMAEELQASGWEVTSRWLFIDSALPAGSLQAGGRGEAIALMDLEDVARADVCISFTERAD